MNAFLDSDTPVQILRRLMVGSEGTLGFIAEAVFDTVRDDAHHLTSLMLFPDMEAACSAVAPFVAAGAAAVELMDRASIAAVRGRPGVPERWDDLPAAATGLLVEFRDETPERSAAVPGRCRRPARRHDPARADHVHARRRAVRPVLGDPQRPARQRRRARGRPGRRSSSRTSASRRSGSPRGLWPCRSCSRGTPTTR